MKLVTDFIFYEQEVILSLYPGWDRTGHSLSYLGGQCGVSPVDWRRDMEVVGGGSRCFYPPPSQACRPVCLSVCPALIGEEAPPPCSQQPAASLLLSPALCSALLRPCGLARRRSFLRDNKSAESLFSTEGWIRAFIANGGRNSLIYKDWISPYLFAVSDCVKTCS